MTPVFKLQSSCMFFLCFMYFFLGAHGDCGPPPTIPNTKEVLEKSGTPGQSIVYECDSTAGYYGIPGKSRTFTCQDDGTWTSIDEFCTRACGAPERLEYAVPNNDALGLDIFYPGQNVSYDCRRGYSRVPGSKNVIFCLDSYTWSTPEKFCKLKSCGNPGEPVNGYFEAEAFTFGSRVKYFCNEGYSLKSSRDYRVCQADGTWSNAVPICEVVLCPSPGDLVNGTYYPVKDEYSYLDAVTFTCQKPLELIGTSSIACRANGTWSDSMPTCKAVNCPNPVVRNSRRLSGFASPYGLHSAISFECEEGYLLSGTHTIKCNSDSQWVPDVPKCLSLCNPPPILDSASLNQAFEKYPSGTVVRYDCNAGYERNSEEIITLTCLDNSQWSKAEHFCKPKSCGHPGNISNGIVSFPDDLYHSKATYTCNEGYQMKTSINEKVCQEDGTWTGAIECIARPGPVFTSPAPVEPVTCDTLSPIPGTHRPKLQSEPPSTLGPQTDIPKATSNSKTIGIILGVVVLVLLCISVPVFLCFWKKKKSYNYDIKLSKHYEEQTTLSNP